MASDESEKSVTYDYEDSDAELLKRVVELEVQVRRFAARVEQLVWQRHGLVALLRGIKDNGGCNSRHWRYIDRILATTREWKDEDSGRH